MLSTLVWKMGASAVLMMPLLGDSSRIQQTAPRVGGIRYGSRTAIGMTRRPGVLVRTAIQANRKPQLPAKNVIAAVNNNALPPPRAGGGGGDPAHRGAPAEKAQHSCSRRLSAISPPSVTGTALPLKR